MSHKIIDRRGVALGGQANNRNLNQITDIAWHYTATLNSFITNHERYWRNTLGWTRGGYHFYIDRDGNIYQNYNYRTISNGVGGNNSYIVNISLEASSPTNYTDKQVKAREWLTKKIMKDLNIPASRMRGHKEFPRQSTACPGYSVSQMNSFRTKLAGGKDTTPSTSAPSTGGSTGLVNGARFIKNENGYFLVTTDSGIKVRTSPNTASTHTTSLKKGASIKYDKVYEGNGFRWLRYQHGGKNVYVPYRRAGAGQTSWGTFHSSKPGANASTKPGTSTLVVDGYWGKATTRALQSALGTPVDGVISKPSVMVKSLQKLVGTKVDGFLGPNTYRKLQQYLGTPVDGKLSRPSLMVMELQRRLNAGTLKNKPATSKPKPQKENLVVDGKWGPATTRALQRHYKTVVDGKITGQPNNQSIRNIPSAYTSGTGSLLVRAMQKDLGTVQDGKISNPSNMIRALQRRLGTPVDGRVSSPSLMVKEMQRRLNNGTF